MITLGVCNAVSDGSNGDAHGGRPVEAQATEKSKLSCAGEVRLLVLDDDSSVCRLIQAALGQDKFTVDAVSDPTLMEAKLRSGPYHVIILDYVIPGVDSDHVLEWVRSHQAEASIIVVTAFPSIDSALHCLRAHTYDYLTKPFQIDHLQKIVRRCLESKGLLRLTEQALLEQMGATIRERRKSLGLTLKELAERSKVSLGYLSQIELGKNAASIDTLYKISLGLRLRLADLFQGIQGSS